MSATLSRRAFLGAELPGDAEAFSPAGMLVAGVIEGGMADRAGLAAGDTIVAIAGVPVRTLCELAVALRLAGRASTTHVAIVRGGSRLEREVEVIRQPVEPGVSYGELPRDAVRLRTLAVEVDQPRALVLVIQGIACESIELALSPEAPLAGLIHGWARAGIESLRFDKRGVGDSEGVACDQADFATERADAAAALELARTRAHARGVPLFVFGHSVGGMIAATLASDGIAGVITGVITFGAPVARWIDCLVESTRRQLVLHGAAEDEIARRTTAVRALATTGELNGRAAAYHAQLDQLDVAGAWAAVTSPILVLRGEHDWVVDPDDQARVAALAPGETTIVDLPDLDHLFGAHADRAASLRDYGIGAFDVAIVDVTRRWIYRYVASTATQ